MDPGLRLLLELTRNIKGLSQVLLDKGGFECVETEMTKNGDLYHLQVRVFAVLRNFTIIDFKKVNGAVSLILTMIGSHKEKTLVQSNA